MEADDARFLSEFWISEGPQYVIPVYQRHYTWDSKNVFRLLNDIYRLLKEKGKTHFIGNIVYVRKSEAMFHEREIVDGQQRVTTLFLVLLALRDLAFDMNEDDYAFSIENLYLFNRTSGRFADLKNKLKPNIGDGITLQAILDRNVSNLKNNKSAVYRNYCNIKTEISRWITEDGFSLEACRKAIDSLIIVWVALSPTDDAQQIFESINSTGEPLTASDLIRNFILMNKDDNEQTRIYSKYWIPIEENICPDAENLPRKKTTKTLEEFFRFLITALSGELIKKDQVYIAFKNYWEKWINENSEEELLELLLKNSRYWNILYKDDTPPKDLKKAIFTLRTIDSNMPTPFLLSAFSLYEDGIISVDDLSESINLINIYSIRRHMNNLDTSSITQMFPTLFKGVAKKCEQTSYEYFVEALKYVLVNAHKTNAMYMPNDQQTLDYLSVSNAYTLRQTKTFFSILESATLDTGFYSSIKDNPIHIDLSALTVEHIMPQEATAFWRECVDDQGKYEYYVNLLGNLTLADKKTNTRMSNRDFEYKKNALKSVGRLNMNVDIISRSNWDYIAIVQRTKELAQKFIETFPYFESTLDFSDNQEIPEKFNITLTRGEISVTAILYKDKTVDILAGSTIRKCPNRKPHFQKKLTLEIDREKITDRGDVFYVEEDICGISSISSATDFVYGGSNNGWIFWEDENGIILNDYVRSLLEPPEDEQSPTIF